MSKLRTNDKSGNLRIERYVERNTQAGRLVNASYIEMFRNHNEERRLQEADPEWQKDNLEWDLRTSDMIHEKCKQDSYAQNLYAALCNMQWQRREVMPILKDQVWSCSWRYAGGIIADIQEQGDYMDWYCSGIAGGDEPDVYEQGLDLKRKGYVPEGHVTEEIQADLESLGWQPVEWKDKD